MYNKEDIINSFNEYLIDNEDIKQVTFKVIDEFITWQHYDIVDNIEDIYQVADIERDIIAVLTEHYGVVS